mgnify:CR=1 FL=1
MSFLGNMLGNKTEIARSYSGPPPYAEPYYKRALDWSEDVSEEPLDYYPGATTVGFSDPTLEGLKRGEARARAGSTLLSGAQDFVGDTTGGGFTNPALEMLQKTAAGDFLGQNKYLAGAMQPGLDAIKGQFSAGGRLGSGANVGAMTSHMAPIYARNYERERANQLNAQRAIGQISQEDLMNRFRAADMAPDMAAADYDDSDRLLKYGAMHEAKEGEKMTADMAKHDWLQNEEQRRLSNFLANIRGGTVGSTTTKPVYSNPAGQLFGNLATLGQGAYFGKKAGLWS